MTDAIRPFRIEIPQADVDYLHGRLATARASAAHTLYEQAHSADWGAPAAVPAGFAVFGADETVRRLVTAPDGAHWTEFPRGRHFPAIEAPVELAADLRVFFEPLR